ncbi:very short patch repair endonuclease [Phosphitispora fastidiosa]|uniref:very short patch repair endonuclease n=1 Tax=Phosphitispora fastidiosa TaxID=2837202 RepID=UPI001E511402|nr:DNA mismatch endonuclease Vsr [Phosphitispora fastidiosa]MBU7008720.1 DNA mismatch endonuclease (patch repair protein) [Phosphitispora fastidiosa]
MADTHSKETRSYNMSHIRSRNTQPETMVRKFLFSKGLRFRKNDKRYPGHPDILLSKYRAAVFINGCFWHCHEGCSDFVLPKSNQDYWEPKLRKNRKRDEENYAALRKDGWNVYIVWECELKKAAGDERLEQLYLQITK